MHQFTYASQSGDSIDLDCESISTGTGAGVRSAEWRYKLSDAGALTGIDRKPREAKLSVVASGKAAADRFCRLADRDMKQAAPATLTAMGAWKQRALIPKIEVSDVRPDGVLLSCTALLLDGVWRKVERHVMLQESTGPGASVTGLDYPHDYQFDYAGGSGGANSTSQIVSVGSKARITFFGPCANPYVRIGANTYGVSAAAADGEMIVIDPTGRKVVGGSVYKRGSYGEVTNLYDKRMRGAPGSGTYVFEELPEGLIAVSWPQSFRVDIETIEERGMPPWI